MASSFVDLLGSTSPGIKVRPEPDAIHRHAAAERAAPEPNFDISVAKGSMPSAFGVAIGPRPAMAADAATASGAPLDRARVSARRANDAEAFRLRDRVLISFCG